MNVNKVPIIVGPTAVGKTELVLQLAQKIDAEIVSADSRQIYKYMDIGTAKPTSKELENFPHHFIDIRTPDQYFSAGEYGREARVRIKKIHAGGRTALVVGGSGFYIQALVDGLFAPRISDPEVKKHWHYIAQQNGTPFVLAYLRKVDPVTAERLQKNDLQRIVRAIEVFEISGRPISEYQKDTLQPAGFTPLFFGLNRNRQRLYERIEQRVDRMIRSGLVYEVQALKDRGWGPDLNALRTVGYTEVFAYLEGKLEYHEMVGKIKQNTRRYAKRQLTWFKRDERILWMDLDLLSTASVSVLDGILKYL
ncbi:tRNA (adenosine(37)-N6)-dimethylallyltransferase MiaA [candidate division KSB1 bacterium]|nr:tRNA (adenosine(37)-N6)-dimethylallyltransferase MiaA [candidate division KSB1 bacterium]